MSFGKAVADGFSKYATFSGRSRRSAYWYWVLFAFLIQISAGFADRAYDSQVSASSTIGWTTVGAALILALPSIAVTVRRLHDTGRSGWWWLLSALCGIGAIIVFVFCLGDSAAGDNQYGPNPKSAAGS